jgi:hypothetical protein
MNVPQMDAVKSSLTDAIRATARILAQLPTLIELEF